MFMGLLSLLSCAICYAVAFQSNIETTKTYQNFLFSTTYGAFGANKYQCSYSTLNTTTNEAIFNLNCPSGSINRFQAVFSNESLNSLFNCRNQRKKLQYKDVNYKTQSFILLNSTACDNNDSSKCQEKLTFNANTKVVNNCKTIAYNYQCLDSMYYFSGKLHFKAEYFFYAVVAIDFFIFVWLIIFMRCEIKSQEKQKKSFRNYQYSLENFTIEISGFKRNQCEKQLNQLLKVIATKLQREPSSIFFAYTIPLSQDMKDFY